MDLKTEVGAKGSQMAVKQKWSDLAPRFPGKPFRAAICKTVALVWLTVAIVLSLAFATSAQQTEQSSLIKRTAYVKLAWSF